ncbi:MAG: hypothetical protein QUU85_05910, partial [Candidatus Eisenbacteria bacterium]|nr:hypothetical protein [Candidatus Eisenbacteria bacterium]
MVRKHRYLLFEATRACQNDSRFCYNVWKEDPAYPPGELPLDDTLEMPVSYTHLTLPTSSE